MKDIFQDIFQDTNQIYPQTQFSCFEITIELHFSFEGFVSATKERAFSGPAVHVVSSRVKTIQVKSNQVK
jgi:hypothetical protein